MKRAAFFDMDRTLLVTNSAVSYVRWQVRNGESPRSELVKLASWLTQYSLGVLDAEGLAQKVTAPYRGVRESDLRAKVAKWVRDEVLATLSGRARSELDRCRSQGDVCVLLTSATPYAAEPVARAVGIDHVLCSRVEVRDGVLTGKHLAPLCYGHGKVEAAERFAREHDIDLDQSSFYTDSVSDLPMLERVARPVAVNPDPRLYFTARTRGWPIHWWRE
ncbi:MAG: HAD family hydrolase [Myxococcales bacterium]|nr:HAD family hydrolase [Myxococcales bacterium]